MSPLIRWHVFSSSISIQEWSSHAKPYICPSVKGTWIRILVQVDGKNNTLESRPPPRTITSVGDPYLSSCSSAGRMDTWQCTYAHSAFPPVTQPGRVLTQSFQTPNTFTSNFMSMIWLSIRSVRTFAAWNQTLALLLPSWELTYPFPKHFWK